MVKIRIEHTFEDITPEEFWAMMLHPAFDGALESALGVKLRKELERKEDERSVARKVRVIPGFPVPAAVKKLFGDKELEYLELSTYWKDRKVMDWSSQPNMFADKVVAKGTVVATPVGSRSLRRLIEGEINVNIFGVGGVMERVVEESVRQSYEKAAAFTRDWIRQGKHRNPPPSA